MKIVGAIVEKTKILIFFLCELPLISRVDRKRKKRARDICKGTLDIEFERYWSVGLGATIGDATDRTLKTTILVPGFFFSEKAVSTIFLGFVCTVNQQNIIKFVGAIF